MGKGDKKTRKGKIRNKSYGKFRNKINKKSKNEELKKALSSDY